MSDLTTRRSAGRLFHRAGAATVTSMSPSVGRVSTIMCEYSRILLWEARRPHG